MPSLQGGFVWDDDHYIQHDPLIYSINLNALFSNYVMGNYHPLTMTVYAIEYHFFGLSEKGYHAVNLFIHLLNVILVFYVVLLLSRKTEVALVASLLFGIHPMHVESVAWASELKDLLYTFFFLASYICYLKYLKQRKAKFYIGALLFFLCSLFSKGMAVCMPVLLVLTDYFIPYLWSASDKVKRISSKAWLEKVPFFALAVIFGVIAIYAQRSTEAMQSEIPYVFTQRIVIACFGFVSYLVKLVMPVNLCAFYPYPVQTGGSVFPLQYYTYAILFVALAIGVYYSFRFTKKILFGFGFFAITIFLVLQLLPVGSAVMADRYSYLSSVGIFYLAGEGFFWLWSKKNLFINARVFSSVLLCLVVFFFSLRTQAMCEVWKNSLNLWSDVISQYQSIPYAYNNRGVLFMNDKPEEAISDFSNAIKLKPNYPEGLNNRGIMLLGLKHYDAALADLNKAIESKPNYAEAYNHRALLFEAERKYPEALSDYTKAIELKPDFSKAYYNRGTFYINQNKLEEALNDYNTAIALEPDNIGAYNNRGNLLSMQKKNGEAINDYNKVIELSPNNVNAYYNRGTLLMNEKRNDDAISDFSTVIQLQPNSAGAFYNKGIIEYTAGRKDAACNDLQQAAKLGYQPATETFEKICH